MLKQKSRWITYNNWSLKGPYMILISDCEWWDENVDNILNWFDCNCPDCKPEPNDTIITFKDQSQYALWSLSWGI